MKMIIRKDSYPTQQVEKMRDGDGVVTIERLLTPEELYDKGRLYAILTLPPGASIGYHVHEGEMESFYVISGKAEYNDNGETVTLMPGDTSLTAADEGHSIRSIGDTDLALLAQILYK